MAIRYSPEVNRFFQALSPPSQKVFEQINWEEHLGSEATEVDKEAVEDFFSTLLAILLAEDREEPGSLQYYVC